MALTSLTELGDSAQNRRLVFELNRTCAADIPGRVEFFTLEEYLDHRFGALGFRPDGHLLLRDRQALVGLCQVSLVPGRTWAFVEMTGLLRPYRGRGLARLLKLAALHRARGWGAATVRTVHHPSNAAVIAHNRGLGFTDVEAWPDPPQDR